MTRLAPALLIMLALAVVPAANAQQPKVELYDVEDEVMCVTCNVPLFMAESPQADRQRALIRGYISDGLTKDQIKARLLAEYGKDVLAMPDNDGRGLAAKLVPVVAVLGLVTALVILLPRWRRRDPMPVAAGGPDVLPATDAELRRLDDDLERRG